jgi:ABC-type multidrug transport system, ATPase component
MKNIVNVTNLTKKFDAFTAVNDISFSIKEGEILGLLGPNGAGKTTTIQMLLSTMIPTSGSINYFGQSLFTHRAEILERVAFASTYVRLPGRLSIIENLDIYGQLYGVSSSDRKRRIEKFLKFFGIWDIRDRSSGVLSAGQITRVMLVKAFLSHPEVVLLDEPTASLDPDIALEVRKFIKEQQQEYGVSILLTSHNMAEVADVCDRVLVLQNGTITADDTPQKLAASVKSAHLHLLIVQNMLHAKQYLDSAQLHYKELNNSLEIELDEQMIAPVLHHLAKHDVHYDQISIDKPTLEDYFLQIAQNSRTK